jgi:ketosteroid isomerase-like protein
MPSANVDLVRSIFASWEAGDFSSAGWAHPDIVFSSPQGVESADAHGLAEMSAAWGRTMSAWREIRTWLEECRELDAERVLALWSFSGHGKLSGLDMDPAWTRGAALFRIEGGRVAALTIYVDRDRALAELGIEDRGEVVRRAYDAWSRGEIPGPAELFDPDVEYVNPAGAIEPGTRRGLAELAAAIAKVFEGWESWEMQPQRYESRGDRVAVEVSYKARGRGSGLAVQGRESALWTVRGGRVTRYEWFHEAGDAFDALARQGDAGEP